MLETPAEEWSTITGAVGRPRLTHTDVPRLLFHGNAGVAIREAEVAWCREHLSDLDIVDLGDASHAVQETHPDKMGTELSRWYADSDSEPSRPAVAAHIGTSGDAHWSGDGLSWTRTSITERDYPLLVAAYNDGYVAVSAPSLDGAPIDTIWYSADAASWSPRALQLSEPTHWNDLWGNGQELIALGGTETNLFAAWRWSKPTP